MNRPPHAPAARAAPCRSAGFTLIELLVAITIMSMLALLSWRSLDGMTRTQTQTQQRADDLLRFQAALGQWTADLDAIVDTREVTPLNFDGRLLRLTRRDAAESGLQSAGVRVVAWTRRGGPLAGEDGQLVTGALAGPGQWPGAARRCAGRLGGFSRPIDRHHHGRPPGFAADAARIARQCLAHRRAGDAD